MTAPDGERSLAYLSTIPVSRVKGLTGKRTSSLKAAGIESVTDLLFHVPRRYIDRSTTAAIADIELGEEVTVVGTVQSISMRRVRRNLAIINAVVSDGESFLFVTWFNQTFRERQLPEGTQVALSGKIERKKGRLEMKSPEADVLDRPGESLVTGRVVPVHPGVKGVGPGWLRRGIHNAVKRSLPVSDPIPAEMRERLSLMDRSEALEAVHFPESMEEVPPARDRLAFDELFRLEVALALQKRKQIDEAVGIPHVRAADGLMAELVKGLPFPLTAAQHRVIDEVQADMARPHPMHRLLLGDVGSGKTVVAVAAMLTAVDGGHQGAVMAPTEVLAVQHFLSIGGLLAGAGMAPPLEAMGMGSLFSRDEYDRPVRIALLTGSNAEVNYRDSITRADLVAEIADGSVDIVVGTHALIQEGLHFHALGVAVVDEQHRFGVHQRVELREKGAEAEPDLLIMTATPIPRTLSMTLYGDLDVSSIGRDEMPPGRPEVETVALAKTPAGEEQWLRRVKDEVAAGHQAFVVCPLVEDSPKVEAASATAEHKRLADLLPDLRVGLLHGQMVPADKASVMASFRDRELDVLVATTVIEVGIDIPHSTVMVIEDADRFGLSQLHQLRGRLSRGVGPNYCFLVADPATPEGEERLAAMVASDDGFVLAEEDLRIRGTGTVFGARQAGAADLRIADILRDTQLLISARREAFGLVAADHGLSDHPDIATEIRALIGDAAVLVVRLMRVIAGSARGRRLQGPPGDGTRPMMDRVKEALFSSLSARVVDARVLDLYAGSGALGIESLSRGASSVVFVERGRAALATLRANLVALGFEGRVVAGDVGSFLAADVDAYDLVFVDPPYRLSLALVGEVLEGAAALLANGGTMVLHRRAGESAPDAPAGITRVDDRRYGTTQLWIYQKDES